MISLVNKVENFPYSMCDSAASQDGRFGWFLLTYYPQPNEVLDEIQTDIKLKVRNADFLNTSKIEIESKLKTFFGDLHWSLYGVFHKSSLSEKGISLLFAIIYDHELFVVQFGRLLCGRIDDNGFETIGRNWKNFHVKTLEDLSLLGLSENDIKIKPIRLFLAEKQYFIALPAMLAGKLANTQIEVNALSSIIDSLNQDNHAGWFILESKEKLLLHTRKGIKRFQISAIIITIITLLSLLYVSSGNRFIEQSCHKLRMILLNRKQLTIEQIPDYFKVETENFRKQLEKIANQPARNISLSIAWQSELEYSITAAPAFDLNNIYVASDNLLMVFNKKSKRLVWKRQFDQDIFRVMFLDGNLTVILEKGSMVMLSEKKELIWRKTIDALPNLQLYNIPIILNYEKDPRIDGAVLILPQEKSISILDLRNGEILSKIDFTQKLQYMSEYDTYDNCLYAVTQNGIICVRLDIKN